MGVRPCDVPQMSTSAPGDAVSMATEAGMRPALCRCRNDATDHPAAMPISNTTKPPDQTNHGIDLNAADILPGVSSDLNCSRGSAMPSAVRALLATNFILGTGPISVRKP